MASFNKVMLMGNLVRDPELKELGDDKVVCEVPIAVNEGYKEKQTVHYIDLVMWNQTARFAGTYLGKGANVMVEGRLQQDRWETPDGKRSKHKIVVDKLVSVDKKGDNPRHDTTAAATPNAEPAVSDLPFQQPCLWVAHLQVAL